MKQLIARALIFAMIFNGFATTVMAQATTPVAAASQTGRNADPLPDRFETRDACHTAVSSGNYRLHEPSDTSDKEKMPALGGKNVLQWTLPGRVACAHSDVDRGKKMYVPVLDEGFQGVIENGKFVVQYRSKCGNATDEVTYPPLKLPVAIPGLKGDPGKDGLSGGNTNTNTNTVNVYIPQTQVCPSGSTGTPPFCTPPAVKKDDGGLPWGWIGVGVAAIGLGFVAKEQCWFCKCPPGYVKAP